MTRDDDLLVSCQCGRIEIHQRGGYHTCNLSDAASLGHAANTLCRRRDLIRQPWLSATIRGFYVALVAFLVILLVSMTNGNENASILASMRRAHGHYMRTDYRNARTELLLILKDHPGNQAALASLRTIDDADR